MSHRYFRSESKYHFRMTVITSSNIIQQDINTHFTHKLMKGFICLFLLEVYGMFYTNARNSFQLFTYPVVLNLDSIQRGSLCPRFQTLINKH